MANKLYGELAAYTNRLAELKKRFMEDGKIDKAEQAQLDVLQKKIDQLKKALNVKAVVDFSDDDDGPIEVQVATGDAGIPFEQQIVNILQSFKDSIRDFWTNYLLGIENFQTRMEFASDQEAEPQYLQAVFKALAKQAFDKGLGAVESALGPVGEVVKVAKTAVDAWADEDERAKKAGGQVKIADYIESLRNGIPKQRDAMVAAVDKQQKPLINEFRAVAKGHTSPDGHVVGAPAEILNKLTKQVDAFKKNMPTAQYFQHQFTTKFADTPGMTARTIEGGTPSGTIYFDVFFYIDPDDDPVWKKGKMGEHWKLVTSAPNPDRVATSLARSLEGKKPWQIDLPKMVSMSIEVEETGTNPVLEGYIYFTKSPDDFKVRTNYSEKWFKEAWMTEGIRKQILEVGELIGGASH